MRRILLASAALAALLAGVNLTSAQEHQEQKGSAAPSAEHGQAPQTGRNQPAQRATPRNETGASQQRAQQQTTGRQSAQPGDRNASDRNANSEEHGNNTAAAADEHNNKGSDSKASSRNNRSERRATGDDRRNQRAEDRNRQQSGAGAQGSDRAQGLRPSALGRVVARRQSK